jgi:hypothetical protein
MNRLHSCHLLLFLSFFSLATSAQTSSVSPYSRFGPGDLLFIGSAHQRGLGGTGIADAHSSRINTLNPASYGYDSLMIFEFGVTAERIWLRQGGLDAKKWNAKIEYLKIQLPLKKNKWGLTFGLMPFNGIGYTIETNSVVDSANSLSTTYEGKGGYNRYFMGTGIKLFKGFSIGVNVAYLFGAMDLSRKIEYSDENFFGTRVFDDVQAGDFMVDGGLHYRLNFQKEKYLSLGVTYTPEQEVSARRTLLWETFRENSFGVDVPKDTILYLDGENGTLVLPAEIAAGFEFGKGEKWLVRSDFRYREWSKYQSFEGADSLENSIRFSLGGQYVQDPKGNKVYHRIQYRAGMYFHQSHLNLRNNQLNDIGVALGVGIPMKKAYQSMLNFGIEAGQRGTTADNLIQERYVRIVFGLTFNENWFQKRRYE